MTTTASVERTGLFPTAQAIWHGQVPLKRMLWFYVFVGFLGLSIPINGASALGLEPQGPIWLTYCLALVCYATFVNIGTWRAATRYQGSSLIKYMSKFTVIMIFLIMIASPFAAAYIQYTRL